MWIFLALGASLFWGFSYVISEQVYKHISVLSSLAIAMTLAGIMTGIVAFFTGDLSRDVTTILTTPRVLGLVVGGVFTLVIAELFIGNSIAGKNAALAGLIEISYPLFIVFFSYVLFKENTMTFATTIGAVLIFSGVGLIYAFNR